MGESIDWLFYWLQYQRYDMLGDQNACVRQILDDSACVSDKRPTERSNNYFSELDEAGNIYIFTGIEAKSISDFEHLFGSHHVDGTRIHYCM
jgi:hypothetical protein